MSHCSFCELSKQESAAAEQARIIKLLTEIQVIRRDALGLLCAFNTDGTKVVYLNGLETGN